MSSNNDKIDAQRTINNGRMLILVTALPLIGSLIKKFYIGNKTISEKLDEQNPVISLIDSFPALNLNEPFVLDNFIILGFLIGLFVGISTLKKGISKL